MDKGYLRFRVESRKKTLSVGEKNSKSACRAQVCLYSGQTGSIGGEQFAVFVSNFSSHI